MTRIILDHIDDATLASLSELAKYKPKEFLPRLSRCATGGAVAWKARTALRP